MSGRAAKAVRRLLRRKLDGRLTEQVPAGALDPGDEIVVGPAVMRVQGVTFLAHVRTDAGKFTTGTETLVTRIVREAA